MEDFTALKLLSTIEKILNIHRDLWYLPKRTRFLILLIILLDVVITILFFIDNLKMLEVAKSQPLIYYSNVIFHTIFVVHSFSIILYFGPRFGGVFKKLMSRISCSHHIVKYHAPYRKSIYRLRSRCIYTLLSFIVVRIIVDIRLTILFTGPESIYERISLFSYTEYTFVEVLYECRCVVVLSIYYCLLAIVRSILQAITALVTDADVGTLTENLDIFATDYRQLLEICRLIKKIFGQQVFCILFLTATHFVYIVYRIIKMLLEKRYVINLITQPNLLYHLTLYCATFVIVAKSGQGVSNEAMKLVRCLAQIRCKFDIISKGSERASHRGLKDFHQLVARQPLKIELLATMPVGMYFLPAVLSLIVTHIIVTLQLNKDI